MVTIGLVITPTSIGYSESVASSGSIGSGGGGVSLRSVAPVDLARLSDSAKFINNLQEIRSADPVRFRSAASNVAIQLQSSVPSIPAPLNSAIRDLATAFQGVAAGGDFSALAGPIRSLEQSAAVYTPQGVAVAASSNTAVSDLFAGIVQEVSPPGA